MIEDHISYWIASTPKTNFPPLKEKAEFDVVIIGGGIAGISTAYFLKNDDLKIALIEAKELISGVTGNTTAKITALHDLIYDYLIKKFGLEKAKLYASANQEAIDKIESIIKELNIDCEFYRLPAYTFSTEDRQINAIKKEVAAAKKLDLPASFTTKTSLPFPITGAIRLENQAYFHPNKYLQGLIKNLGPVQIFEGTRILKIEDKKDNIELKTESGQIKCKKVAITTNFPIYDPDLYFTRLLPKRSYVIAGYTNFPIDGMYLGLEDSSIRPHQTKKGQLLIIGGQSHIGGRGEDTNKRYQDLANWAKINFKLEPTYAWSTQDNHTYDRVPLIGQISNKNKHIFVATGFKEWGMTQGTIAGQLLADLIKGKNNKLIELYDPSRKSSYYSGQALPENIKIISTLVKGKLEKFPPDYEDLSVDQAKVIEENGKKFAVYKDKNGKIYKKSAACTHMGCIVNWNPAEKSWDCPCHGSRFSYDGQVLHSPATKKLSEEK